MSPVVHYWVLLIHEAPHGTPQGAIWVYHGGFRACSTGSRRAIFTVGGPEVLVSCSWAAMANPWAVHGRLMDTADAWRGTPWRPLRHPIHAEVSVGIPHGHSMHALPRWTHMGCPMGFPKPPQPKGTHGTVAPYWPKLHTDVEIGVHGLSLQYMDSIWNSHESSHYIQLHFRGGSVRCRR